MGIELKRALDIVLRTAPYVVHRASAFAAMCLCVIAYLAMLFAIGSVFGAGAFWVLFVLSATLLGLLGVGGFINEYIFHHLRAGHIAVIAEIVSQGKFPTGISQTKWARGRVAHYFRGAGRLAHVRRLTRDVIRAINRKNDLSIVMPLPGIETGTLLGRRLIDLGQTYIEEAVFAYAFRAKNENIYESAKHATLVYSRCWKSVLANSIILTLFSYAVALVSTVIFLVPLGVAAVVWFDGQSTAPFVLFATGIFLGFAVKWAIFDPVAGASIIIAFLEESEIIEITPELEQEVEQMAQPFEALQKQANEYSAFPGYQPSFMDKPA